MAIPLDWPSGVPEKLQRQGYSRQPQDLVHRMKPDAGPPMRRLIDGAAAQSVKGVLSLSAAEAALFDAFLRDDLGNGLYRFNWTITDNGAAVVARLAAQPRLRRQAVRYLYELDIACDAPAPSPAALSALAALEDLGPAAWPGAVPFRPQRASWSRQPDDQIMRSAPDGFQSQGLISRAGADLVEIVLMLTSAQVSAFEAWFAAEAGFGVRDISFPDLGDGRTRGFFDSVYAVAPGNGDRWAISFRIGYEAVQ